MEADEVRALRLQAFFDARTSGDPERLAAAALRLPSGQRFGVDPGQVPALIHEAYSVTTSTETRARLAAALARAWVYGGDPKRAPPFADEAVALAERAGDAVVLADALEAALVARWGPDDFADRLDLAAKLADTAAHLTDPELRLSAHLWRLTTAWESLDIVGVQRQLRALDLLAADSGETRVAFFAASRRAMHALVVGDVEGADELIARTTELGSRLAEPDLIAVTHSLATGRARLVGDIDVLRAEAPIFEAHGDAEGIPSVLAEAAVVWLAAGEIGPASALLDRLAGSGLGAIGRDVDFLLTTTCLVEVAAATGRDDIAAEGADLLEPYAGRGVLNAGALTFHGVVDDYLYQAHRALGRDSSTAWRHSASACYRRIGATWWDARIEPVAPPPRRQSTVVVHLHPQGSDLWTVGYANTTTTLPDRRGLHYLRLLLQRPGVDIPARTLSDAAAGHPSDADVPGHTAAGIEVIDRQALGAYRARLRDIDVELAEAESWSDAARLDRLQRERDALLAEVRSATGLGGRERRTGSADERARVAVRKAVAAALDHIDAADPSLGRLLRDTVRTGASCRYDPDPSRPITWILDSPA